jgi:hypothetical protein
LPVVGSRRLVLREWATHRGKRRTAERLTKIKVEARDEGVCGVPKKVPDETLIRIEETQAALRESIEKAKQLADDSARLISKHRDEIRMDEPPNPAS